MPLRDTRQVQGLAALSKKLEELEGAARGKALRGAALSASLPTFRAAQAGIPVGKDAHRTYKGRLVAPGFARRNIRRVTRLSRGGGSVSVLIGVRREAFYAVQFLELGTSQMAKRPWLVPAYNATYRQVTQRFAEQLEKRIKKAAK